MKKVKVKILESWNLTCVARRILRSSVVVGLVLAILLLLRVLSCPVVQSDLQIYNCYHHHHTIHSLSPFSFFLLFTVTQFNGTIKFCVIHSPQFIHTIHFFIFRRFMQYYLSFIPVHYL